MKKLLLLLLLSAGFIQAQTVFIPNVAFKNYLKNNACANTTGLVATTSDVDTNDNGEIEVSEALAIKTLVIGVFPETTITNLQGLEAFTNLERLTLQTSNASWYDYRFFTHLIYLKHNAQTFNPSLVTSLYVMGLSNLKYLIIGTGRNVTELYPVADLTSLEELEISENRFNGTTLNNLPLSLKKLKIQNNCNTCASGANWLEGVVNFSYLTNLIELDVSRNDLTGLILNLPNLTTLNCDNNLIENMELFNMPSLTSVRCQNSGMVSIDLKDGVHNNISTLLFTDGLSFKYICKDEDDIIPPNTELVTSYCEIYHANYIFHVRGNNRLDVNNNGCTPADVNFPNLRFHLSDGTTTESLVANASGAFDIPLKAGTHTITPILENPNYYNVFPASVQLEYPTTPSPTIQNFCITPNGNHQDLEVILIPISNARPGFNADYKLVYKNKGNQSISGHVDLDYSALPDVLELVSAIPSVSVTTSNFLSWNYTNLLPFESRVITLTLNLNAPSETPPLNAGDYLGFAATIYPVANDENERDNFSELKQLVVNSLDPNDKTCLEGDSVGTNMIGNYAHYVIRFENTGTYPAENVIVKDMIDTAKFDVESLVPLYGSHPYVTRITNTNKVEFIFENINLPFDPATNKGYFSFKIKLKDNLVLGDTFSNQASIYFDYNLPIITNNETTTIATLSNGDFAFDDSVSFFPNPAKDMVNIKCSNTIKSIQLFDVNGRILSTRLSKDIQESIDIADMANGIYFLKVTTQKGIKTQKIIKE